MPRAALSEDEIDAFRRKAVGAATRLFAEQGYEAVSMRSVAKAVGVSAMTPYRYFANKDELFAQVRTEAFRRFADAQQQAFASTEDPRQRLIALAHAYVDYALADPDAYRIMFELSQAPAGTYPELDRESGRAFSFLLRATEAVGAREPIVTAQLSWAQVHGLVSLHLAGKLVGGRTLPQLLKVALETLV